MTRRPRLRAFILPLLLSAAAVPAGAAAQTIQPLPGEDDPANVLARHLKSLAEAPRNLYALKGAGEAALEVGDPEAALGFFVRAEEVAPRDGEVKAGIGSALVMMGQPWTALKFFTDAGQLGLAESAIAGDRGLAHDLVGRPQLAQRDYRLALGAGPDAEVTRRLALSLAISGDREGALQLLEDQLLQRMPAAWRTRAFVLALTGDLARANEAAGAALPPYQADQLAPFFEALAALGPADKASAVHFGHFPRDPRATLQARATPPPAPPQPPREIAANRA
ncbi:MAG: tetratricopeptide repeat protein, partial [Sphingomonadaceae bacterium]